MPWSPPGPALRPRKRQSSELARRIGDAEKISIFAGIGCTDARSEVLELAARLNAPIGHTLRGKDLMQIREPVRCGHDRFARLRRLL